MLAGAAGHSAVAAGPVGSETSSPELAVPGWQRAVLIPAPQSNSYLPCTLSARDQNARLCHRFPKRGHTQEWGGEGEKPGEKGFQVDTRH